jgi:hypothetical protein
LTVTASNVRRNTAALSTKSFDFFDNGGRILKNLIQSFEMLGNDAEIIFFIRDVDEISVFVIGHNISCIGWGPRETFLLYNSRVIRIADISDTAYL